MAYAESEGGGAVVSGGASAMMGWLGALTSAVLVGGLGYWVYDLATRDAREIPVVRAMVGPARSAPDDPGGFEAAHQGYAVNNLASEKSDLPLSERVVLAPAAVEPAADDTAPGAATSDPLATMRDAVDGALSELLGGAPDTGRSAPLQTGRPRSDLMPAGPRPVPRPARDVVTRATVTPAAFVLPDTAPRSMDASEIVPGTRLVQLGDFATEAEAIAAWSGLRLQFSDFLDSKARVIVPAPNAGQPRFRLRAHGFDTLAEARNFCAALVAEQADCIPVRMR